MLCELSDDNDDDDDDSTLANILGPNIPDDPKQPWLQSFHVTKPLLRTSQTALDAPICFLLRRPIDTKTDAHLGACLLRT